MRRRWSRPTRSRWCGSSCSRRHEDASTAAPSTTRRTGRATPTWRAATEPRAGSEPRPATPTRAAAVALARARAFAEPLLVGRNAGHRRGRAGRMPRASPRSWPTSARRRRCGRGLPRLCRRRARAARRGADAKAFGAVVREPGRATRASSVQIQRAAREAQLGDAEQRALQTERVRKMLLAFSRDLRVVLLRLASRLQTLRCFAASKHAVPADARARVACRCSRRSPTGWASGRSSGSSRTCRSASSSPRTTSASPRLLDERRVEREARRRARCARSWSDDLARARHRAPQVQGRPKHLYSIWKKMRGKALDFDAACSTCSRCA